MADNNAGGASRLLTYNIATASLTNIQAVGLYVESTTTVANYNREFGWASFSVSAIPEPSALALVGLGLLALFGLRRRRRY